MQAQLQAVLDERVRPYLQSHGGDAEILSYDDGVLRLRMMGQCATCPAALLTNETLIEAELKEAFPALTRVLIVQETSPDLIAEAKQILSRGNR